jgi:hypothetical protein
MQVINRVVQDVGPLARVGLGLFERGYGGVVLCMKALRSLRVAQFFLLSLDTVSGVPTPVFYQDVEH